MAWTDERLDDAFTRIDRRFDGLEARLDARFNGIEARLDARFDRVEARVDSRIDGVDARVDGLHQELHATHRQFIQISWAMLSVIVAQATIFLLTH